MAGILDFLKSDLGKTLINGVAGQTGQDSNKTNNLLTMALPVLMQAMKNNASTAQGAEGLLSALNSKHDGGILDNIGDLFGGNADNSVENDGEKILSHVLGRKKENVQNNLSQKSGIDSGSVAKILAIAAPILMGVIGKKTRENSVKNQSDLGGLLGGLLKNNSKEHDQNFLESILDSNGDGNIIDDVAGMVLGKDKKKSGLGGLLGGLFGKK